MEYYGGKLFSKQHSFLIFTYLYPGIVHVCVEKLLELMMRKLGLKFSEGILPYMILRNTLYLLII